MLIGAVIALCVILFILALLAPRLSRHPENGAHKVFGLGARGGGKAPGKLGQWLAKPFNSSSRAVGRSASKGREANRKIT